MIVFESEKEIELFKEVLEKFLEVVDFGIMFFLYFVYMRGLFF